MPLGDALRKRRVRSGAGQARDSASASGLPILIARDVSKTFSADRREPVSAIASIDLEVGRGEFLSLVGPSGAGKTTLLKIFSGLIPATSGDVIVDGRHVNGPIEDFGIAFQNSVLLPWRTALANVLLPIEMLGRRVNDYEGRARELLHLVGLQGFEDRRPRELSGGMQQRVALCRALIHDPAILLMDEPFGSLDEFTRQSLNDYLLTLWESSKKTIVFVTHSVAEAVYLSDRVAVMSPRPSRLLDTVEISLPRPRVPEIRFEAGFSDHVRLIQRKLSPS